MKKLIALALAGTIAFGACGGSTTNCATPPPENTVDEYFDECDSFFRDQTKKCWTWEGESSYLIAKSRFINQFGNQTLGSLEEGLDF